MKLLKRWLVLMLTVVLLLTNVVYSLGSTLKANEIDESQRILNEGPTDVVSQEPPQEPVVPEGVPEVVPGENPPEDVIPDVEEEVLPETPS